MQTTKGHPNFISHFYCKPCFLSFRSERPSFLVKKCCPACSQLVYPHSWSFNTTHLTDPNFPQTITTLAADVAYAVRQNETLFPEPEEGAIIKCEIDADHWPPANRKSWIKLTDHLHYD